MAALAVLAAVSVAAAAEPKTCALYFDFHEKKSPSRVSHLYFGEVADDGTFEGGQRADLGLQYDPQGQLTVAPDGKSLAFTGIDNRTAHDHFGCCDRTAVIKVDIASGESTMNHLARKKPVAGATCGLWGCGFLEIGRLVGDKVLGWVEPLLPPTPPGETAAARAPSDDFGLTLAEFDLTTGEATATRPFALHYGDAHSPQMTVGTAAFSGDKIYFACNPDQSNDAVEGVCSAPTAPSKDPAEVGAIPFEDQSYTITSVEYSKALEAPVVLAQKIPNENMTATKVYAATSPTFGVEALVDLGEALGSLHQTTMSADGRYLMVLATSPSTEPQYPKQSLVTVDLVAKKVVKTIDVKDTGAFGIATLAAVAC